VLVLLLLAGVGDNCRQTELGYCKAQHKEAVNIEKALRSDRLHLEWAIHSPLA
jgi:hypothetical protein